MRPISTQRCWRRFAIALPLPASLRTRRDARISGICRITALGFFTVLAACSPKNANESGKAAGREEGALCRVGSIVVYQTDLKRELEERHANPSDAAAKKKALDDLVTRAQFADAALVANLDRDPEVRAQVARTLASRLKEQKLLPRLKEINAPIPEARLRELYQAEISRFRSNEKRQVAVLWLNPNNNPERAKVYQEKLTSARDWLLTNGDLKDHPDQGFSVLSVDHSEHAASRYKGGVVGWMERVGGLDEWSKAVAEIAFSLKEPGEVSTVTARPEGVFLVRYMASKPAFLRPFEAVSAELERAERQRMRAAAEAEFESAIKAQHPVQWLTQ
jgi:hypothetical protein